MERKATKLTNKETIALKKAIIEIVESMVNDLEWKRESAREVYRKNEETGDWETVTVPEKEISEEQKARIAACDKVEEVLMDLL